MTIEEMKTNIEAPVVVVNEQGLFIYVNRYFEEVFGWSRQEIIGQPLTMIIPPNLHDAHNMGFSRFITSEKATIMHTPLNLKAVDKKGRVFDAEHFIIAEKEREKWLIASIIKPIEAR